MRPDPAQSHLSRHVRVRSLVLVAATISGFLVWPAGMAPASSGPRLLWGAKIGTQFTGTAPPFDMSAVSDLRRLVGKAPSLVAFGSPFEDCSTLPCSLFAFPARGMSAIRSAGAIPFFSWSSEAMQSPQDDPNFTLADIISGHYDSYIKSFGRAAKRWGHPFFLRFDWEMNGNWYPWAEDANGNSKGQFVAAWRHVHNLFKFVGATNASWVWCPNIDYTGTWRARSGSSLSSLYPGDGYVNWTCLDGFNFGTDPHGDWGWTSFDQLYESTYRQVVKFAPSKPMIIGEIASTEYGGSKAGWISHMLSELPTRYPQIRGLVWYEASGNDIAWPIESSRSALTAFARAIRSPSYVGGAYSRLAVRGAVRVPGPSIKAVLSQQAKARARAAANRRRRHRRQP